MSAAGEPGSVLRPGRDGSRGDALSLHVVGMAVAAPGVVGDDDVRAQSVDELETEPRY